MNDNQLKEFETKAKELMRWLRDNCHPHMTIIITQTSAELLEGVACATASGSFHSDAKP